MGAIPDNIRRYYNINSSKFSGMMFFVGSILRHWYFLVAVPAVIVTYALFKVLRDKGIIDAFERTVQKGLDSVIYISQTCFPYIPDMHAMLRCINGAP